MSASKRFSIHSWVSAALFLSLASSMVARGEESLPKEAAAALQRAVKFFHTKVASHGGYVYQYSADLTKREGEGKTGLETLWVQPPGTPTVGLAYVEAFERDPEPYLLDAARSAADCLLRGQLRSGGWNASVEFGEPERSKQAYRVDPIRKKPGRNWTTFDDNKTQAAVTFLMRLDQTLKFQDATVHEAAQVALDSVLKSQFPNGGWPQGYQEFPDPSKYPVKPASYPAEWPRKYPGGDYWVYYTFNDNAIADTIDMLFLATEIYQQPRYREAAIKAGGFILLSQMPEPQPAWAQQYDFDMHPVWARKFEPPAISGGESQGILRALHKLYVETGDRKFLAPVPKALAYLQRSRLSDGKLPRFLELQSNKPLYFTKEYVLTYDDSDVPTHYGFKVPSNLDAIARNQAKLEQMSSSELESLRRKQARSGKVSIEKETAPEEKQVREVIAALDDRGAWVEDGQLRYHGKGDDTRQIITTTTFVRNLALLSRYVGKTRP